MIENAAVPVSTVRRTRFSDDPPAVGQCPRVADSGERCVRSTITHSDGSKHTRHWPANGGATWIAR